MDGRRTEEVYTYKHQGVDVMIDGKVNEEVNHRIGEAKQMLGGLQKLGKKR